MEPAFDTAHPQDQNDVPSSQQEATRQDQDPPAVRIHIAFPASLKARLDVLRRQTGKASLSELFRSAIMLYDLAHKEHLKGSDLLIRSPNGDIERLKLFL